MRHSERIDQVKTLTDKDKACKFPSCDPPITENGKNIAFEAGLLAKSFLETHDCGSYLSAGKFKLITSPFIRTLQTAAYFRNGSGLGINEFLLNPNIAVKLSRNSGKVFSEGVLAKDGDSKTLKNWMDLADTTTLVSDKLAANLFKTDGSYTDGDDFSKRYSAGVQDIVSKHFVHDKNSP